MCPCPDVCCGYCVHVAVPTHATQVLLRRFILAHGYETSYTCLARRAAKTNNVWNRLVRRGSIGRRICVYGALQLAFTVISCSVFLPTYFSYGLAVALQVRGALSGGRQPPPQARQAGG